jgi:hypothetical protein
MVVSVLVPHCLYSHLGLADCKVDLIQANASRVVLGRGAMR